MIVRAQGDRLLIVTQPDHAHFSGELLSLWRTDGLPDHPRRPDLLFAAREHDNGWREADAAPAVNPATGLPHDFLTIPREIRLEIWRRGARRFAERRPYAALLITQHALQLHRDHRGEEAWEGFFAELAEIRQELHEETGVPEEDLLADYRFVDLADVLSLTACNGWSTPFRHQRVRGECREGVLQVEPFPLAGATTFSVPCRWIPHRRYRGDADLGSELAAARWEEIRVRVAPYPQ